MPEHHPAPPIELAGAALAAMSATDEAIIEAMGSIADSIAAVSTHTDKVLARLDDELHGVRNQLARLGMDVNALRNRPQPAAPAEPATPRVDVTPTELLEPAGIVRQLRVPVRVVLPVARISGTLIDGAWVTIECPVCTKPLDYPGVSHAEDTVTCKGCGSTFTIHAELSA